MRYHNYLTTEIKGLQMSQRIQRKLCYNSTTLMNFQRAGFRYHLIPYTFIISKTPSYLKNLHAQNIKRVPFAESVIL